MCFVRGDSWTETKIMAHTFSKATQLKSSVFFTFSGSSQLQTSVQISPPSPLIFNGFMFVGQLFDHYYNVKRGGGVLKNLQH